MMKMAAGYAGIGMSEYRDGAWTHPRMVIDTGSHLSFPLLFERGGKLYMMPESCAEGCVQVFACERFPDAWRRETVVLDGAFSDSVPFEWEGEPYLFTSKGTDDMYGNELFLFALRPEGGLWKARAGRSVSKDYRVSRMAGKVLPSGGKTYRVAQDCSRADYGRALVFSQILSCSPQQYTERQTLRLAPRDVRTAQPLRGKAGIHTYNRLDDLDVIDFKLCTFSLKSTVQKFRIVAGMLLHRGR